MKRFLSLLLSALMLLSVLPFAVFADESAEDPSSDITSSITGLTDELNRKLEEDKASTGKGEASEYPWDGLSDVGFKEYVFAKENADYLKKLLTKTGSAENKAFRARVRAIEDNAARKAVQDYLDRLVSGEEDDFDEPEDVLSAAEREALDAASRRPAKEDDPETEAAKARAAEFAGAYAGNTASSAELLATGSGICGDNLKWELTEDGVLTISGTGAMYDWTFSGSAPWHDYASSVKSVVFSGSVTTIGNWAFRDCSELSSIRIPDGVTSIGEWAFSYCSGLSSVTIPSSVKRIGQEAFYECGVLKSVTIPDGVTAVEEWAFGHCSELTSVTIPSSVKSIGNYAFYECWSLNTITLPEKLEGIGDAAFYSCGELTSLKIPNNVTNIGEQAFAKCTGLETISLPNKITGIGDFTFQQCTSLTSVTIPEGVTGIGECAFSNCSFLSSITLPSSVKSIGTYAFYACSKLTSLTLPNGLSEIGEYAFSCCYGLTSVTIPASVKSIAAHAFALSASLKDVYYSGTEQQWKTLLNNTGTDNDPLLKATVHYTHEHTPVTDPAVKATYFSEGLTEGSHCSECGEVIKAQETVQKLKMLAPVVTVSKNKATVAWTNISEATGYRVVVTKNNETKGQVLVVKKGSKPTAKYSGLVPGNMYHFTVTPLKGSLEGLKSEVTTVTVYLDTPKLKVKRVGGQMSLSWSAVKGATGYELKVTDSAGNTDTYKYGSGVKKATVQGKLSGKHTLSLTAYTSAAVSKAATAAVEVALDTPKLKAKVKNNVITVSWSAVKGTAGYELKVTDSAGNTKTEKLGPTVKKATLTVAPSGAYTISLTAYSGKMTSKAATVKGTVALTATALKAKAGKGTVALSWKQVKTANAYEIWRADGASTEFKCIATVTGSVKKYADTKVTAGTAYTYKIRPMGNGTYAYGKGPVIGSWSATVKVTAK